MNASECDVFKQSIYGTDLFANVHECVCALQQHSMNFGPLVLPKLHIAAAAAAVGFLYWFISLKLFTCFIETTFEKFLFRYAILFPFILFHSVDTRISHFCFSHCLCDTKSFFHKKREKKHEVDDIFYDFIWRM